jgi:hypothetical protein
VPVSPTSLHIHVDDRRIVAECLVAIPAPRGAFVLRNIAFPRAGRAVTGEPVSSTLAVANRDNSPGLPTQRQRPIRATPHKTTTDRPLTVRPVQHERELAIACAGIISDPLVARAVTTTTGHDREGARPMPTAPRTPAEHHVDLAGGGLAGQPLRCLPRLGTRFWRSPRSSPTWTITADGRTVPQTPVPVHPAGRFLLMSAICER